MLFDVTPTSHVSSTSHYSTSINGHDVADAGLLLKLNYLSARQYQNTLRTHTTAADTSVVLL